MRIGLLGALINNENMGCVALTYSLINLLEEIARDNKMEFEYYVFESRDGNVVEKLCNKLGISRTHIKIFDVTPLFRLRRFLHHFFIGIKSYQALKKCDVVIDVTGGDSFTDIYGQYTFDSETNVKLLVERMGIPLILAPQTYGPFNSETNIEKAKKAIEGAVIVISRDQKSADYIARFSPKTVHVTTDMAFCLPFHKEVKNKNGNQNTEVEKSKIRIGINVSGLLLNNKTEKTTLLYSLKTDYDTYICGVIDWLLEQEKYDIYIIPHVGKDGNEWIQHIYGDKLQYFDAFNTPIDAKNAIAKMDIFIGSRMHATIGSFSTGVATIPVAYSRKFSGLFEHLGYEYVVDLCVLETWEAVSRTMDLIKIYPILRNNISKCATLVLQENKITKQLLEAELIKVAYERR